MQFNRRHILLIILTSAVIVIFLPIPVRYSFITSARIYPLREWTLTRGQDEGFWSQTYDYETDAVSDFRNYRFERGDIAELKVNPDLTGHTLIGAFDTVASIQSYLIENELTRLQNLRDIETANLHIVASGEKQPLIDQAQKKYDYALQQFDLQQKNYNRQHQLFLDSVISPADEDIYANTLKLAEINSQVALNELVSLQTGEKSQVVTLAGQQVLSYDKEIERLETQKQQYTIVTPMGGLVSYDPALGGILKVSDFSRLVLKIPVPYYYSSYLDRLHSVRFSTPDNKIITSASFRGFDENVKMIQNRQYVMAKAVTNEVPRGLYPGMVVRCRIYCDKVSLFEYLKRNFMLSF